MTFGKLDFTALVLDKNLTKKNKVLAFFQNHGNCLMQVWISKNQRRLKEYLEDAQEWGQARTAAAEERLSDWALLGQEQMIQVLGIKFDWRVERHCLLH